MLETRGLGGQPSLDLEQALVGVLAGGRVGRVGRQRLVRPAPLPCNTVQSVQSLVLYQGLVAFTTC